jgi:hypothetical protein
MELGFTLISGQCSAWPLDKRQPCYRWSRRFSTQVPARHLGASRRFRMRGGVSAPSPCTRLDSTCGQAASVITG